MIVSVYTGVLAIGVILRGYQMDRPAQQWSGFSSSAAACDPCH